MRFRFTVTAIALASLAVLATAASGAASREEFVAKVDPICKRTQKQAANLLKRAGRGDHAQGKAYAEIARKGRAAFADIYHVGPAPSDLVTFDRWIQKDQRENALVVRLARSLKAGHDKKASIFLQKATDTDKRAEKVVRDFGFKYCSDSEIGTP